MTTENEIYDPRDYIPDEENFGSGLTRIDRVENDVIYGFVIGTLRSYDFEVKKNRGEYDYETAYNELSAEAKKLVSEIWFEIDARESVKNLPSSKMSHNSFILQKYVPGHDCEKHAVCSVNDFEIKIYLNHTWEWDYNSTYYGLPKEVREKVSFDEFEKEFSSFLVRNPRRDIPTSVSVN